jgi:quercetin dioxygenase-like cupin family protein
LRSAVEETKQSRQSSRVRSRAHLNRTRDAQRNIFSESEAEPKAANSPSAQLSTIDDSAVSIDDSQHTKHPIGGQMPAATSFEKMEKEQLSNRITRQMLNGEDATLARIFIARGGIVPRHSHRSEQFSFILSGALKFIFDDSELVLRAGEIVLIPANVPHRAEALEDTVDIDFFAPRREDWIRKDDAYLRGNAVKD